MRYIHGKTNILCYDITSLYRRIRLSASFATMTVLAPQAVKLPDGKPLLNDLDFLSTAGEINVSFHKQMRNEQMAMKLGI